MTKTISTFFLLLIYFSSAGQNNQTEIISNVLVAEGKMLYKSEKASWYGTDVFLKEYNDKEKIGGYFSYTDGDTIKNIFFSKGLQPKVIGTISFDSTFNVKTSKLDLNEREFTKLEADYYLIREKTLIIIKEDSFFKRYEKTNFNLIPLILNGESKVYVITGPKENGAVLFGNDYLLTFDQSNNLIGKKQLHKSLISAKYGNYDGKEITAGYHTHLPDNEFITSTDICTLMLYEKICKWENYTVVSTKYFSIWNCKTDKLLILTTEDAKEYYKQKDKDAHN